MSRIQQKRLYEAERCLWGHGRHFSNNEEVVIYLDSVITSDWFVKVYGWIPSIQVKDWNSEKWAGAADKTSYTIYLNRRTENVVLHELSHLLCPTDEHDEIFVFIYEGLIRNAM
jgi:hypothetical protein